MTILTASDLLSGSLNRFKIIDIKESLRHYKQVFKSRAKKQELLDILSSHLLSETLTTLTADPKYMRRIVRMQAVIRGWLVRNTLRLHGPGALKVEVCANEYDPVTLTPVADIPPRQFYSYKNCNGKIYGFDVHSIKTLLDMNQTRNPFNREEFPDNVRRGVRICWAASRGCHAQPDKQDMTLARRAFQLFHDIYLLTGNFADERWFLDLSRNEFIEMYKYLYDLWNSISPALRSQYVPRTNRLFGQINEVYSRQYNTCKMQTVLLSEFEKLVRSPLLDGDKVTTSMWILIALTRFSGPASWNLPHLAT